MSSHQNLFNMLQPMHFEPNMPKHLTEPPAALLSDKVSTRLARAMADEYDQANSVFLKVILQMRTEAE